jgi:hypothetical protein
MAPLKGTRGGRRRTSRQTRTYENGAVEMTLCLDGEYLSLQ